MPSLKKVADASRKRSLREIPTVPGVYIRPLQKRTVKAMQALPADDVDAQIAFLGEHVLCDEKGGLFDEFREGGKADDDDLDIDLIVEIIDGVAQVVQGVADEADAEPEAGN